MTSSSPRRAATARAVTSLSPVTMTTPNPARFRPAMASAVVRLIGSDTAIRPASAFSRMTYMTVAPCSRSAWTCAATSVSVTFSEAASFSFPSATCSPSTMPRTPWPVSDSNSTAFLIVTCRSTAASTMADARGCSLPRSRLAANDRSASLSTPVIGSTAVTFGLPSVRVPVLSTSSVSMRRRVSTASALRNSTPVWAPLPIATVMDMGVASPSAQGQAMISTATAFTSAWANCGAGPRKYQAAKVATATTTTAGTNQADTRSASDWIGARLRWAAATWATMRASSVSAPTRSAHITKPPVPLRVPATTLSPARFSTGNGSPVSMDSSTVLAPSSTTPSTGIFSPGRTRS